jgi:hypothetical protein
MEFLNMFEVIFLMIDPWKNLNKKIAYLTLRSQIWVIWTFKILVSLQFLEFQACKP